MFPEQFVEQQLLTYTTPGDIVFDPFCGRGTTVFESLLKGRPAAGSDLNPVATCIASAKAAAPPFSQIIKRIDQLEEQFRSEHKFFAPPTPFFEACFHPDTLSEIMFLRCALEWKKDAVDCFVAAIMLGIIHGESHRSEYCLSNRMPRTISTKPDYSIKWWSERNLTAPRRETFEVLRKSATFRYRLPPAQLVGVIRQSDARQSGASFPELNGKVRLVVTSPPYLDTTDYSEDQWLRLWFLGGEPRPELRKNRDDRHTKIIEYWEFIMEAWSGLAPLLADESVIVVRIGGAKLTKEDLLAGVTDTLAAAMPDRYFEPLHTGVTSTIRRRETSAFRPAPPRASVEHDFAYRLTRQPKKPLKRRVV